MSSSKKEKKVDDLVVENIEDNVDAGEEDPAVCVSTELLFHIFLIKVLPNLFPYTIHRLCSVVSSYRFIRSIAKMVDDSIPADILTLDIRDRPLFM
jgi:hypothetical protein